MTVSSTGYNPSLTAISNSYQDALASEEKDPLGREAFLTMLVAQLQNQDPLNPMDGTDFTAQLAQFSQLEAQFNTNDTLASMLTELQHQGDENVNDYIGKNILGAVNSIEVTDGEAVGGFYSLEAASDVIITIYDKAGQEVRTLYPGQKTAGTHAIEWDGMGTDGSGVLDGSYTYVARGNTGSGEYLPLDTTISGRVDAVIRDGNGDYIQVGDVFLRPEDVLKVWEATSVSALDTTDLLNYIGKEVDAATNVLQLKDGGTLYGEIAFTLADTDLVQVQIFTMDGQLVRTIDAGTLDEGAQVVGWDGQDDTGAPVPDGVYSYQVLSQGAYADRSLTGEIDGVAYVDGIGYLTMGETLIYPAAITGIRQ
ncbi:MAG: hypothetical protein CSA22_09150 [Deltaproteobacteria bacterium]|nr:MAG: hypothetical protein CSA22_09150 [Deltaproteobacteria bacterium]